MARDRKTCTECGAWKNGQLETYECQNLDTRRDSQITLCGRCLRDRDAAWRTRWRVRGRTFPEDREAA